MSMAVKKKRQIISPTSRPFLAKHVKLKYNKVRGQWVLLAPERLLEPDEAALETLKRCDGHLSVDEIAQRLANEYHASAEEIRKDILPLLQNLADKGFLVTDQGNE